MAAVFPLCSGWALRRLGGGEAKSCQVKSWSRRFLLVTSGKSFNFQWLHFLSCAKSLQ